MTIFLKESTIILFSNEIKNKEWLKSTINAEFSEASLINVSRNKEEMKNFLQF